MPFGLRNSHCNPEKKLVGYHCSANVVVALDWVSMCANVVVAHWWVWMYVGSRSVLIWNNWPTDTLYLKQERQLNVFSVYFAESLTNVEI